jgi:serine O-acetyltransferase
MKAVRTAFRRVLECAQSMREDVAVVVERDPSVRTVSEAVLAPPLIALWAYRVAHMIHESGRPVLARIVSLLGRGLSGGIEIHPGARIGRRLFIDHGCGTVIGETAVIGDDVTIYHQVTLGALGWWRDNRRPPGQRRHPELGSDVVVGANSMILGPVKVGDGARIGAKSYVIDDVAAGALVFAARSEIVPRPGRIGEGAERGLPDVIPAQPAPPGQRSAKAVRRSMDDHTTPTLVIMTSLKMVIRHLRLIEYPRELGVAPVLLSVDGADTDRVRRLMKDSAHPLSGLAEHRTIGDSSVAAVLADVAELAGRRAVCGVISCGEYFVEPAAVTAHLLGLPGSGWPAAAISRNKLCQRMLLPEYSPRWRAILPGERSRVEVADYDWSGPLVLKPTTWMSSSGVREVRSAADLPELLEGYPANETLLVEERVVGAEFSVESLVRDGVLLWSGITAKETNEGGGVFVEMAHTLPAAGLSSKDAGNLERVNADVLRRLGFQTGVAHAEYRLSSQGVILMEVALRIPGGGISALWGLATGGSLEERIVDLALGRPTAYPQPVRRARHVFVEHPPGKLVDVVSRDAAISWTVRDARWPVLEPASPEAPARCHAVLVAKLPGDRLAAFTDGDARAVSVLVDAPPDADIAEEAERVRAGIDIVVD